MVDWFWTDEFSGAGEAVIDIWVTVFSGGALNAAAGGCCVDCRFLRSWSRWPLAVAMDGVKSDSLMRSMPGQDCRSLCLRAVRP